MCESRCSGQLDGVGADALPAIELEPIGISQFAECDSFTVRQCLRNSHLITPVRRRGRSPCPTPGTRTTRVTGSCSLCLPVRTLPRHRRRKSLPLKFRPFPDRSRGFRRGWPPVTRTPNADERHPDALMPMETVWTMQVQFWHAHLVASPQSVDGVERYGSLAAAKTSGAAPRPRSSGGYCHADAPRCGPSLPEQPFALRNLLTASGSSATDSGIGLRSPPAKPSAR